MGQPNILSPSSTHIFRPSDSLIQRRGMHHNSTGPRLLRLSIYPRQNCCRRSTSTANHSPAWHQTAVSCGSEPRPLPPSCTSRFLTLLSVSSPLPCFPSSSPVAPRTDPPPHRRTTAHRQDDLDAGGTEVLTGIVMSSLNFWVWERKRLV
jgi:hypothetical protein